MEIPAIETVLPVPAFLSAKVAPVFEMVTASPETISVDAPVAVAEVFPS